MPNEPKVFAVLLIYNKTATLLAASSEVGLFKGNQPSKKGKLNKTYKQKGINNNFFEQA